MRGANPEETLPVACLLLMRGGFIDAFTYVGHGAVFANAMTGNIVLLAIIATSTVQNPVLHARLCVLEAALGAYLAGVVLANLIKLSPMRGRLRWSARTALGLEILCLMVLALIPKGRMPDMAVVAIIAFVAALQSASFTRLQGFAYSSVTTTANLRTMTEALVRVVLQPHLSDVRREALAFLALCTAFIAGAMAGGWLNGIWGEPSLMVSVATLSLALSLCLPWNRQVARHFVTTRNE